MAITEEIMKAPLPSFSALVMQHIEGRSAVPERVWSMLITETAHYYLGKWSDIGEQQHYRIIGQRMFNTYPAIGLEGANPWVS